MKKIVIAGTGTDVGKTLVSAIVTEALEADYWKPVQAGNLENTDSDIVRKLISNPDSVIYPEAYRLQMAASPHAAARNEGIEIDLASIQPPSHSQTLIIEPPGGLMVPLNDRQLNIHLLLQFGSPVILVSQNYLGSINHTLLTVEVCRQYNLQILGIIFNGERVATTENFVLQYSGLPCLATIEKEKVINKAVVKRYAENMKGRLQLLTSS